MEKARAKYSGYGLVQAFSVLLYRHRISRDAESQSAPHRWCCQRQPVSPIHLPTDQTSRYVT
jgi:hypothetical protein